MKIGILDMYMYLPMLALIIGIGFVFFAEDSFRYECQDPINWGTPECTPPICKAAGVCTEDLIKFENSTIEEAIAEKVIDQEETTETIISEEIQTYSEELNCNCREEEVNAQ